MPLRARQAVTPSGGASPGSSASSECGSSGRSAGGIAGSPAGSAGALFRCPTVEVWPLRCRGADAVRCLRWCCAGARLFIVKP
eukprot:scaffold10796_cov114-Isochrysis_galbana.AAC.2